LLNARYKEHIRSPRKNKEGLAFALHILNNKHQYGQMEDVVDKMDHAKKRKIMNIKENAYIYLYKN
jgi:hypothetical protein